MYFESTERVVDRRLALNSWNYGVCIAIIIACGVIGNLAISNSQFRLVSLIGVIVLSSMGILLCHLWKNQIRDYKSLNDAKFWVLNEMAPLVRFPDGASSYEPFRREWERMGEKGAIVSQEGLHGRVLKASRSELVVPTAFIWLFGLILVLAATTAGINWRALSETPLQFQPGTQART